MLSPERSRAINTMSQGMTNILMREVEHSDRLSKDLSRMDSVGWFVKRFSPSYGRTREDWVYDRQDALDHILKYGETIDILANTHELEIGTRKVGGNSGNRKERAWIKGIAYGRHISLSEKRNGDGEVMITGTIDGKPVRNCQEQAKITFFGLQEVLNDRERIARIQAFYSPARSYK